MRKAEIGIEARSPPASLAFMGQLTKHTTVKWPIVIAIVTVSHRMTMGI